MADVTSLEEKLGRSLSEKERQRIGISKLRLFLEELLQKRYAFFLLNTYFASSRHNVLLVITFQFTFPRYMDNVPLIIPLLEKEYRSTTRKMNEINQELRYYVQIKPRVGGGQRLIFMLILFPRLNCTLCVL